MSDAIEKHRYYLSICDAICRFCKCHSHAFGALVVVGEVVVPGYNGPARGVPHCGSDSAILCLEELLNVGLEQARTAFIDKCPRKVIGAPSGERLDLCTAAHAEINAILNCARQGVRTSGATLYTNSPAPCKDCMKYIINAGIELVIYNADVPWYPDHEVALWMAKQAGLAVWGVSRQESTETVHD